MLLHCNSAWLKRVKFLEGTEPEFIAALVLNLQPIVFAPSETVTLTLTLNLNLTLTLTLTLPLTLPLPLAL